MEYGGRQNQLFSTFIFLRLIFGSFPDLAGEVKKEPVLSPKIWYNDAMNDLKILDSAMKTPGWIESKLVKCGKQGCKCTKGDLHGPYFYYRYWKLYHKTWIQKKKYVNKAMAEKLNKAIKKYGDTVLYTGDNPYRAVRKVIRNNIKIGITDMTQRKLAKVSALVNSFT